MLHKRCGFLTHSFTNFMRRTTPLATTHVEVMWFCSIELCATSYSSPMCRAGYLGVFHFLEKGDKVAVVSGCKIKKEIVALVSKDPRFCLICEHFIFTLYRLVCFIFGKD